MGDMRKGLAIALGLAVLAALLAWLARGGRDESRAGGIVDRAAPADGGVRELPVATLDGDVAPAALAATTDGELAAVGTPSAVAGAGTGRLVVLVTWEADGQPAADIGVTAVFFDGPDPLRNERSGLTDAAGRFEVPDARTGRVVAYLDRANGDRAEVRAGETTELRLAIPAGVLVRGLVVDGAGQAVPGASIWLGMGPDEGHVVGRAGTDGRFELRDVWTNCSVGALAEGHVPSLLANIDDNGTHAQEVVLELGDDGASLAGRVLDSGGSPLAGALVMVGPRGGWPRPQDGSALFVSGQPRRRLRTDDTGTFVVRDLPAGSVPIEAGLRGHSPWIGWHLLQPGGENRLDIVLPDSAVVAGVVADAQGKPVAGAQLSSGEYGGLEWVESVSGADGRFELRDVGVGDIRVIASTKDLGKDEVQLQVAAGARLEWNPRLGAGLQIFGRVEQAAGGPAVGYRVEGLFTQGRAVQVEAVTDGHGRFTIDNCADGPHTLSVRTPDGQAVVARLKGVRPGPDEVVLRALADARPSAFLLGRLLDTQGHVPEQAIILAIDPVLGASEQGTPQADTGAFRLGPLRPGEWELRAFVKDHPQVELGRFTLVAGETRDLGALVLPSPGRLVVSVTLPAGVEPGSTFCGARPPDGRPWAELGLAGGSPPTWTSGALLPGDYVLEVATRTMGPDTVFIVPLMASVRVEAGADTRVDLVAERGVIQGLVLRTQRAEPPETIVRVLDAAGTEVRRRSVHWNRRDENSTQSEGYPSFIGRAGRYTVKIECDGVAMPDVVVEIPPGAGDVPSVEVDVP